MDRIEAKVLLKNLLERLVENEDGTRHLSGKLTQAEIDALNFALILIESPPPKTPAPAQSKPESKVHTDSDAEEYPKAGTATVLDEEVTDLGKEIETDERIELDLSSLSLGLPPDNIRLCLDFGTAMSKATLVHDQTQEDKEDIRILNLGVQGDQEEIDEYMLVSSVYIDMEGLLWFGQNAVTRSMTDFPDGLQRRLDNIKRFLSEEGLNEEVSKTFNPTDQKITYGDLVQAYLMFLTWAVNQSLEGDEYPRNIQRRFAMPIFDGEKKQESIHLLKKMLGNAQILADTFYITLKDGIPLSSFLNALTQLKRMKNNYPFIAEEITEPLGVAGSLLSWKKDIVSLVMVVDVGAGTSDFSLFKIAYNKDTGKSASREVGGSARGITEAGNYLDTLLNGYILKKAEITQEHPHYNNILGALMLTIREHKEVLFRDRFVSVSLFNNDVVEVNLEEFLSLEPVKKFSQTLKNTMLDILESIDQSWIKGAPTTSGLPTLAVALTGGGAGLPMVRDLASGEITVKGTRMKLVESLHFPKWLEDEGYDEYEEIYPRIAVSLGGARKNILPYGGKAASTAGDVKEPPKLGGYYQKGT